MGGASPYRARFIGLPNGQPSRDSEGVPLGDNGDKYFGLVNLSNTCYVNSVLQALYFCHSFRKAVIRNLNEDTEDESNGDSLLNSLSELFAQIESQKRSVGCITPRRFLARLRKANDLFCNAEHQDAHEFMQFLLNDLAENLKARVTRQRKREKQMLQGHHQVQAALTDDDEQAEEEPRTWIHDIFQGYLVNQMKCLCCENVTVRRETFLDLSVDIERHTSIAACLRAFESTELLRSGNKFFCDMCGCLQEAEKRLRIYQLPSVLMLHLKRFKYMERLGRSCRLPYRVVFPLQLRVVEHCPPRRPTPAGASAAHAGRDSSVGVEPNSPDPNNDEPVEPSRLFELRAVVVHIGRDSSRGHYVTVVRNGNRFVLLDDDIVRVVEPEVLRSFYGTAGAAHYQNGGGSSGSSGGSHERHSGHHSNSAGWGSYDSPSGNRSNDRYPSSSPAMPLYERAPEGTCCGYLLLYEAVDGSPDHEAASGLDMTGVVDWISEDRNMTDSDSGESTEERPGAVPDRPHLNTTDDSELMQAFQQRCIPRGPGSRNQQYAAGSINADPRGLGKEQDPQSRAVPNGSAGHGGAFAWTAADEDGGRTPTSSAAYGAYGVRTLGSVVPAVGSPEAVSPSRVNVATSPTGSLSTGAEDTDRAQ